jgi:DNA-binding transcriptional MerR regulator
MGGSDSQRQRKLTVCATPKKSLDYGSGSTLYDSEVIMQESFLRSGQLAQLAGVSADTLRHYERKGVLARPRRGPNGYREYPATALQRVQLVRRSLAVGFTLDELANILGVRDRGGAPCAEVRQLIAVKLSDLETQLSEMMALRDELRTTLQDWDARLARRPAGQPAHLLDNLLNSETKRHRSKLPLKKKGRQK